ncbi:GGDEF domain-containing protein [Vibrio sp. VB16]|uniref:GGDEF domain-containing protein n=1 Tax=Vibrio sp. VB16 TaxID=2785746 RepID=UPI0018A0E243|nr:GGDEF domain-containing protein [Vibrio sp. VB16]UGA55963.1 GGDEF domain-containing protein [Vibrio sp. VB16]
MIIKLVRKFKYIAGNLLFFDFIGGFINNRLRGFCNYLYSLELLKYERNRLLSSVCLRYNSELMSELSNLFSHSVDCVYIIALPTLTVHGFNKNFCKQLNYTYLETSKLTVYDIMPSILTYDDWHKLEDLVDSVHSLTYEGYHMDSDDNLIPIEFNISKVNECHCEECYEKCYIVVARDIRERRLNEEALWFKANIDYLTKVPNRRLFDHKVKNSIERHGNNDTFSAVLYVDLDGFGMINERYGHSIGDFVLTTVANRLENCIEISDCISRYGGDEFVIALFGLDSEIALKNILKKIIFEFERDISTDNNTIQISVSIGVYYAPVKKFSLESFVSKADSAMYDAKNSVGISISYFKHD